MRVSHLFSQRSYYLLASGKVPVLVSKYLAGGSLTALMKDKAHLTLDIRPIAVGEASRHLVGNVFVRVLRPRVICFFAPHRCTSGAEKVIHSLKRHRPIAEPTCSIGGGGASHPMKDSCMRERLIAPPTSTAMRTYVGGSHAQMMSMSRKRLWIPI